MKKAAVLLSVFLLSACGGIDYQTYLARHDVIAPTMEHFGHCRSYGCSKIDIVSLDNVQWRSIEKLFKGNKDAETERANIAQAIGRLEQIVGEMTGTKADIAGTYQRFGRFQHDCVDESINTTTYLALLQQKNLMTYHDIDAPIARTIFTTARPGPHQTAVIVEKETGVKYAVDSWFHDNGYPAEVALLDDWRWGWRPK